MGGVLKAAIVVAQRIVVDVRHRGLGAGERLPPEHVMLTEYDVARGTLREALRFLELQGVIELRRGARGGPVVRMPDAGSLEIALTLLLQFRDAPYSTVAEARGGLEPMLARLAATRVDAADLMAIRESVEEMGRGIDDRATFLAQNRIFHDRIARASGNEIFGLLIEAMLGILDGTSVGIEYPERRRRAVHAAHLRIYEALAARDQAAAGEAMEAHIAEYVRYTKRQFPHVLKAPITWDAPPR